MDIRSRQNVDRKCDKCFDGLNNNDKELVNQPRTILTSKLREDFTKLKERESYLTDYLKNTESFRFMVTRFYHMIVIINIVILIDFCLHPERALTWMAYVSYYFRGSFNHALIQIFSFYFTFFIYWTLLRFTNFKTIGIIFTIPLALVYFILPITIQLKYPTGFVTAVILLGEQMRIIMKIWALIADNYGLPKDERASFREAVYYLFAPTLIYQKSYPRSKKIDWTKLYQLILTFLHIGFHASLVILYGILPLADSVARSLAHGQIPTMTMVVTNVTTIYMILLAWYLMFHLWLNIWAEWLCFADRAFYKDWWSSQNLRYFMKAFNVPVHCFLKKYVVQSILKRTKNVRIASVLTLAISLFFHEYAIFMIDGFCPPYWIIVAIIISILNARNISYESGRVNNFTASLLFANFSVYVTFSIIEFQMRSNCIPMDVVSFDQEKRNSKQHDVAVESVARIVFFFFSQ